MTQITLYDNNGVALTLDRRSAGEAVLRLTVDGATFNDWRADNGTGWRWGTSTCLSKEFARQCYDIAAALQIADTILMTKPEN